MHLALSAGASGPHRLLIRGGDKQDSRSVAHILDLHGLPEINEPLPDAPLRSIFSLATLSSFHGDPGGWLRRVSVIKSTNGIVSLHLDPNYLSFNAYGDVTGGTMMGSWPIKTTLKRIEIPDPAKKGRLLFKLVTDGINDRSRRQFWNGHTDGKELGADYFIVLAATEAGPHRLLIREGDTLRHVLPLHDRDRRNHLAMQLQLGKATLQEQQAVAELRAEIGYSFSFEVDSGTVSKLSIWGGDDIKNIDPFLRNLKNVRRLNFNGSRLNAEGITSLNDLAELEQVGFSHTRIHNRGLASVKDMTQLRSLTFSNCQGITDEGVAHFTDLTNLTNLKLYREDSLYGRDPMEELVTDAGLDHLTGLVRLEHLNLMGQKITDVGLERLKGLTNLKRLFLSGEGITDAGLEHLNGLTQLQWLHLFETKVTPTRLAVLKSKLPMLETSY